MSTGINTDMKITASSLQKSNKLSSIKIPDKKEIDQISNVQSVEKHGFTLTPGSLDVSKFSLLINSFLTIFSATGYLSEKEDDENIETLKVLFSGGLLKSVNRIKWNSQINDKRNTGSDTWKQLFYIFFHLWRNKIIIHDDSSAYSIKSAIGYRLINAFTNGNDKPVLEYKDIDIFLYQLTRKARKSKSGKFIELDCPKCNPRRSLSRAVNILIYTVETSKFSYD